MKIYKLSQEQMQKDLVNVLENTHDGFFALDQKWRYLYLNSVAEKYARIPRQQLLGKVIWEQFPNSKKNLFYQKYHEAMASGKVLEFEEHIDQKWFDIHVIPFGKGANKGIWVLYRNISEHKLADERKDEFIRMASHELKTPITSLKLYSELLRDMVTSDEAREFLQNINHQADQLNRLINDMLDLSHIEMGKLEFKKRKIDLMALINEVVPRAQKAIAHKLELKIKTTGPILVHADKTRLTQALTNLINNAVKYSPGRDRIIITVSKNKQSAKISIQDFGIGIDPAYKDQIFDRFFQANGSKSKAFPGLGIGLYLTKTIVEKHHGQIEVESILSQGSTFTMSLPLRNQKQLILNNE